MRLDSFDPVARHLGGKLEPLRNAQLGDVALMEPAATGSEVPDADRELEIQ